MGSSLVESPGNVRGHQLRMLQITWISSATCIEHVWTWFVFFSGLIELRIIRSSIPSSTNIKYKSQTCLNTFSFLLLIRLVNACLVEDRRARVAGVVK